MSVNKAIFRGQLLVNGPVFIIMMGLMGGLMYLATSKIIPWYFAPGSILLGPCIAWVFWSFAITKWRIWALTNVDDHTELKYSAVAGGLIWEDGSFFERTEIRTPKESKLIHELEQRYKSKKEKRKFKDDHSIPDKTAINYSKNSLILKMSFLILLAGIGVYTIVTQNHFLIGSGLILIGFFFSYKDYQKLLKKVPPLIISNQGIHLEHDQYEWHEILGEKTTLEGLGKNRTSYLVFWVDNELEKINIDDYDITLGDLRNKLKIYRGRYHQNINANKV